MEKWFILALFIFALVIIVNRIKRIFSPDCGACSGDCGCCQSSSISEHHIIINEGIEGVKRDEKP